MGGRKPPLRAPEGEYKRRLTAWYNQGGRAANVKSFTACADWNCSWFYSGIVGIMESETHMLMDWLCRTVYGDWYMSDYTFRLMRAIFRSSLNTVFLQLAVGYYYIAVRIVTLHNNCTFSLKDSQ